MSLRPAALVFAAGFALHNADHARRGLDVVREGVIWGGTLVAMLAAAVVTLVLTRHALAPIVATAVGVAIAVGVSASHLLPDWGEFSDSLSEADVDALTWIAVLAEIAGAIVLAIAGFAEVRGGYRSPAPTAAPSTRGRPPVPPRFGR